MTVDLGTYAWLPDPDTSGKVHYNGIVGATRPLSISADYNHFGDIDYFDYKVFVPVEHASYQKKPLIEVYDAGDLDYLCCAELSSLHASHAAWCAVNPVDNYLYSSRETNVSEIWGYEYSIVGKAMKLQHVCTYKLLDMSGKPMLLNAIQGGAFTKNGHLYLSTNDYKHGNAGIFIFSMLTKKLIGHLPVSYSPEDIFGFSDQEIEGITIWDLGGWGQIHLGILDNDLQHDDLIIRHYGIPATDIAAKL